MISTLFSSLNTKVRNTDEDVAQNADAREPTATQPVLLIMQKTMPIFKDIATLWINETSVIEVCVSFQESRISFTDFSFFQFGLGALLRFEICPEQFIGRFSTDATRSM